MKVVLELQDQPSNIKRVTVRHDIVIGRGADCNLRLSSPQVSRRHCFLRISNDSVTISDLDSSNGTFLDGQRLSSGKRFPLPDGTRLAVGPICFVARVQSEGPAGDVLEVDVNDDRIEAEVAGNGVPADATAVATPHAAAADMNFAIESAGPSADEDEPTTDYHATDNPGSMDYFSDSEDEPATVSVKDHALIEQVEANDDIALAVDESDAAIVDAERVQSDADQPVMELSEDDLVVDVDDEVLNMADDGLLAADEADQPVSDDQAADASSGAETEDEEELRNFLQGLD